jgi:hypothetical protein
MQGRKGNLLLYSVLKESRYSPQAALLMLDCDRSLASHRHTCDNDTEDDDDAESDSDEEEEDGDERSPMTALISGPTD